MKSIESSARTMEEAVSQGLEKLGASFEDVKIEILDEGSKGFLGIWGGKPVVVRLTLREDSEAPDVISSVGLSDALEDKKPARKRAPAKAEEKPAAEAAQAPAPKPEHPPKAEKRTDKKPAAPKQPKPKAEKPEKADKPEKTTPLSEDEVERTRQFLLDVTRLMGVQVSVEARLDEDGSLRIDMTGDTLGILIGRRGETLDALQYLTSLYINHGRPDYARVTLDTENYRAKREEALRRLANRMANRAIKTGRKVVMEPMNPYERRILHSALQQNDAVTTHSEGEEPNRHVVITLKSKG